MNTNLEKILEELYILDPELKKHEKNLIQILEQILENKPDTKFDETFAKSLRIRLSTINRHNSKLKFNFMNKFVYAFSGIAAAILIVGVGYFAFSTQPPASTLISFAPQVKEVSRNAFGPLTQNQQYAQGLGGGGVETTSAAPVPQTESAEKMAVSSDAAVSIDAPAASPSIVMPEYPSQYTFNYTGDTIELPEKVSVLKRIKGQTNNTGISKLLESFSLDVLDLSTFKNLKIQNFSIVEDRDHGYTIEINFNEGSVNIYQNWIGWTYEYKEFTSLDQIPSDDKIINIAHKFLKDHDVDVSKFGAPEITNRYWETDFAQTREYGYTPYLPDSIPVTFPQLIDGKALYDENGNKTGLTVNVNIREMIAGGLWGLNTQNYESSEYEAETDIEKILEYAKQGGYQPPYYYIQGDTSTMKQLDLGTPELGYMRIYNYNQAVSNYQSGITDELFVPALIFPILNKPTDDYSISYKSAVIVPLAKDLTLNVPQIMPLMEDTAEPTIKQ